MWERILVRETERERDSICLKILKKDIFDKRTFTEEFLVEFLKKKIYRKEEFLYKREFE